MTKQDRELISNLISIIKNKIDVKDISTYRYYLKFGCSLIYMHSEQYTVHPQISVGSIVSLPTKNNECYYVNGIIFIPNKNTYMVICDAYANIRGETSKEINNIINEIKKEK